MGQSHVSLHWVHLCNQSNDYHQRHSSWKGVLTVSLCSLYLYDMLRYKRWIHLNSHTTRTGAVEEALHEARQVQEGSFVVMLFLMEILSPLVLNLGMMTHSLYIGTVCSGSLIQVYNIPKSLSGILQQLLYINTPQPILMTLRLYHFIPPCHRLSSSQVHQMVSSPFQKQHRWRRSNATRPFVGH